MPEWIARYWLEWLFGLAIALLTWAWRHLSRKVDQRKKEDEAVKAGVQALLRAQMVNDYNKWMERGYAPIYAKDNFENCWINYENLGENGVMSGLHKTFMELPTDPPKTRDTGRSIEHEDN